MICSYLTPMEALHILDSPIKISMFILLNQTTTHKHNKSLLDNPVHSPLIVCFNLTMDSIPMIKITCKEEPTMKWFNKMRIKSKSTDPHPTKDPLIAYSLPKVKKTNITTKSKISKSLIIKESILNNINGHRAMATNHLLMTISFHSLSHRFLKTLILRLCSII